MSRSCSLSPKTSEAELFLPWGIRGFPGSSNGKESVYNVGDPVLIGKIPWRKDWQPTPVPLLESPMDRGAQQAPVHGVTRVRRWGIGSVLS